MITVAVVAAAVSVRLSLFFSVLCVCVCSDKQLIIFKCLKSHNKQTIKQKHIIRIVFGMMKIGSAKKSL